MTRTTLALLLLALAAQAAGSAGPWRSVLYPETGYDPSAANLETDKVVQDFSYAGYRRGETSIPDVAGPIIDATAAPYQADSSGREDAAPAIQAAVRAAGQAGGGVVYLPAGTYRLLVPAGRREAVLIDRTGVVLRGAGRGKTFLLGATYSDMRRKALIRVAGPADAGVRRTGAAESPLSRDLLRSTRDIPVLDAGLFSVGDTVVVRNTIGDDWIREQGDEAWLGKGAKLGGLGYRRTVLAVDAAAGLVTIDAPVRYTLKLRDSARLVRLYRHPLSEVGLEDFSIGQLQHPGKTWGEPDHDKTGAPAYDFAGCFFIAVDRARDCWVRRIASFQPEGNTSTAHLLSNGVELRESTRVTVEDCSLGRPQYGGGGGNGYMFRLSDSAECLLRRCEARFSRHGFVFSGPLCSGNVIHDCLDAQTGRATGADGHYATAGKGSDHHMHFSQANLVDMCVAEDSWFEARYRPSGSDLLHGLTAVHSVFWNIRGTGSLKAPVVRTEQARHGYVVGTSGERAAVELQRRAPSATAPVDHVEGEGRGDELEPRSLYLDQLARRLGAGAPPAQAQ